MLQQERDIVTSLEKETGYVVFNRPHVHNAISQSMWSAIPKHMEKLADKGARVVIFRGEGDSFASGADLEELRKIDGEESARNLWHSILTCLESIWSFRLPTIAMIHGPCIGGGCLLATACDFRIASDVASFAVPVSRLGLLLDDRTIARLVAAAGMTLAKQLLLAGDKVSAQRALELGYLLEVTTAVGLQGSAAQLASRIARNVQPVVAACKQSINLAQALPASGTSISDAAIVASYLSEEFRARVLPLDVET